MPSTPPAPGLLAMNEDTLRRVVREELALLLTEPKATPDQSAGRWLTAEQVAQQYGLTLKAVYRRASRKQLPTMRLGRRSLRFDRTAIDRLLHARSCRAPLAPRVPSPGKEPERW